jgi:hypothetical protein
MGEKSHVDTWEKIPFLIMGENYHSLQMGEYDIIQSSWTDSTGQQWLGYYII